MNNLKTLSFRNKRTLDMFIPSNYNNRRGDYLSLIEYISTDNNFKFSDFIHEDKGFIIKIYYALDGSAWYEPYEPNQDICIGYTKHDDEIMKMSPYSAKYYFQNQIDFMSIYNNSIGPLGNFATKYHTTYKSMFNISGENRNTMLWISEEKE